MPIEIIRTAEVFDKYFAHRKDNGVTAYQRPYKVVPDISRITPAQAAQREQTKSREYITQARVSIQKILIDVEKHWPEKYTIQLPINIKWIDAFDKYYDRVMIQKVVGTSEPRAENNLYVRLCFEFGTVLASVLLEFVPDLSWSYELPFYETGLYDVQTHTRINIFHWAIKKLSDYGVDDGYSGKVCSCIEWLRGKDVWQRAVNELRA